MPPIFGMRARERSEESALHRFVWAIKGKVTRRLRPRTMARADAMTRAAEEQEQILRDLSGEQLEQRIAELRQRLVPGRRPARPSGADMALLREVGRRTLGLRAHDVQLIGAAVVTSGRVAEMATGEGKTLVAGLAAAWQALGGTLVHVVTVNDYLAARDAETLGPFYAALGLRVGVVTGDTSPDQRHAAYRCPICYCTNTELAFD
ncbi:MAG: translocase, partial [Roseovarius sp.]